MTVTLNDAAFDRAEKLIMDGEFVLDDRRCLTLIACSLERITRT
jgi:hypothetical protein